MILIFSALGLVIIMAWTIYRINSHRKKVADIEDLSRTIGEREAANTKSKEKKNIDPIIPASDLLVVMYTNKGRPWRVPVKREMKNGKNVMVVSSRTPDTIRKAYPGLERMIYLDRSTAHEPQRGVSVINPTNLSGVLDEVKTAGSSREGSDIVVFEDFEMVISANGPERSIRFLNMVKELCMKDGMSVLVPVAYKAVKQRTRNQLQEVLGTVVV